MIQRTYRMTKKDLYDYLNRQIEQNSREARENILQINSMIDKLTFTTDHSGKIVEVLSWDCGLKSTSWLHIKVSKTNIDVLSYGTIDFIDAKKMSEVSRDDWPRLIKERLDIVAPKISPDCVVTIELQRQKNGKIDLANIATQFGLSFFYYTHKIIFMHARQKNTLGPLCMVDVARVCGLTDGPLRKKHTRLNFELFMIIKYRVEFDKRKKSYNAVVGTTIRDASDAFMQGLYCALQLLK